MIEIDGGKGESGGQMVRTAVALSAVTGNAVRIINIRAGRCNPGLRAQHLKGVLACKEICDAEIDGAEIGSSEIIFKPKAIKGGSFKIDVGTAGSTALILQTLIPVALHAQEKIEFEIVGGTNVKWSMDFEYMQHIFGFYMQAMGVDYRIELVKRGFYPKGGGKIIVNVVPSKPKVIELVTRGEFQRIDVRAIAEARLEAKKVAERELDGFSQVLKPDKTFTHYSDADSIGTSMHAHAHYQNCKLGSSVIGEVRVSAEEVGKQCALGLKKQMDSEACVDEWMADQILPFMAFAGKGRISVAEVTEHTRTNISIIEKFLDVKFSIEKNIITVEKV
jgi:RNA 3'-phosphate cyclase